MTITIPHANGIAEIKDEGLNKINLDTITQNFSKMQENFFNFSKSLEELENNFKQVSQSFSAAKEHVLNLAVNYEGLENNFLNCHPDTCML